MVAQPLTFEQIQSAIAAKQDLLQKVRTARGLAQGTLARPSTVFAARMAAPAAPARKRTFNLLAQGDSWFDYPPGLDLIKSLHQDHGHTFAGPDGSSANLAAAGSTLNAEAYGPIPTNWLGIRQSDEPVPRIVEFVQRIQTDRPDAVLLSAGGNDVAGDEFFSFIENADSGLEPINDQVMQGVLDRSFRTAFKYIIDNALKAAAGRPMPIFIHGYDYPWPDGRGVVNFGLWKIGPWFNDAFNDKNYPYVAGNDMQLKTRRDIVSRFIDALNTLIQSIAQDYAGKVIHVDLTHTLTTEGQWANELHPTNEGFQALSAKLDAAIQAKLGAPPVAAPASPVAAPAGD